MCATSPTGTGKTGAYLLPLLAQLLKRPSREGCPRHTAYPPALILAPTRELVAQVGTEGRGGAGHKQGPHMLSCDMLMALRGARLCVCVCVSDGLSTQRALTTFKRSCAG